MKSNTNKLRLAVAAAIKNAVPEGTGPHYVNFPKPAIYPYSVYELRETSTIDGMTSYALEIDCVSRDAKTTIEMADAIQDAFDHKVVLNDALFFHAYRNRRYAVIEEDKGIERIHLSMDLFFYTKEE